MNRDRILAAASDPEVLAALVDMATAVEDMRRVQGQRIAMVRAGIPLGSPRQESMLDRHRAAEDAAYAVLDRITTLLAKKEEKDRGTDE